MTYEEYTKVIDTLCIEAIQVVVNLETEYKQFKNLDLITGYEEPYEWIDEFADTVDSDLGDTHIIFCLDPKSYEIKRFFILEERENIHNNVIMRINQNNPMRQIVLDYSVFVKLIS